MTGESRGMEPVLDVRSIVKSFGHVHAVKEASFQLRRGEILGVVGDNGAGKSTLMRLLAGMFEPDRGEIEIFGSVERVDSPERARQLGIEMIHQNLALFNNMDVASNIFIGRERVRRILGFLPYTDKAAMRKDAQALLTRLGVSVSPDSEVGQLSGGQRQIVAIARAVAFRETERILIMDEPTAALGTTESETVNRLITNTNSHGVSIIIVSHRIPDLLELADRVLVMKGGRSVAMLDTAETTVDQCVELIVSGVS